MFSHDSVNPQLYLWRGVYEGSGQGAPPCPHVHFNSTSVPMWLRKTAYNFGLLRGFQFIDPELERQYREVAEQWTLVPAMRTLSVDPPMSPMPPVSPMSQGCSGFLWGRGSTYPTPTLMVGGGLTTPPPDLPIFQFPFLGQNFPCAGATVEGGSASPPNRASRSEPRFLGQNPVSNDHPSLEDGIYRSLYIGGGGYTGTGSCRCVHTCVHARMG